MAHQGPIHNIHNALIGEGKNATMRVTNSSISRIDEGLTFGCSKVFRNVPDTTFVNFVVVVPSTIQLQGIASFSSTSIAIITAYGLPTISNLGTPLSVSNFNTTSTNTPQTLLYHTATVNNNGIQFFEILIPGGSKGVGASTGELTKFILGPGTYLIRLEAANGKNAAEHIAFQFDFFEDISPV